MGRGLSIVEKDPVSTKQLVLASPPPAASRRLTDWDLTVPLLSPRLFVRISQRKGGAGLVHCRDGPSILRTSCSGLPAPSSLVEADRVGCDHALSISAAIRLNIAEDRWGGACPFSKWTNRPPYTSFRPHPPPAASWRLTEWGLTVPFLSPQLFV